MTIEVVILAQSLNILRQNDVHDLGCVILACFCGQTRRPAWMNLIHEKSINPNFKGIPATMLPRMENRREQNGPVT
ncbi:hypothetical protein ScPMuIL_001425 [Solemya velum]